MLFKNSPEKFWDMISSMYASKAIPNENAYRSKIEKLKSYLSPDDIVLDIGCGTGTQCLDLAANIKRATGIDISKKLLRIAEQRKSERQIDNVNFINAPVFDKQFKAESFDVVMAFYVMHFFEDIDVLCSRIHELLKPDGLFISESPCLAEQSKIVRWLMRVFGGLGLLPRMNMFSQNQLEQSLAKAGFELLEKNKYCETQDGYTIVARKRQHS